MILSRIFIFILFLFFVSPAPDSSTGTTETADIVIYGGTSAGVAAAIQASRMGKKVILLEPTKRLGGLTTGGLGQTDIGNKQAIGGIAREFYRNVQKYYNDPDNWKWQEKSEYMRMQRKTDPHEDAMWTFEPSAALKIYEEMIARENIEVRYNQRLDRQGGVERKGKRITAISMLSGESYTAKMFIDATYEGDLMASAGVSYTVGRESNNVYGENLNGVQPSDTSRNLSGGKSRNGISHNFEYGVDPYVVRGKRASGLLPYINPAKISSTGTGDKKVQAYCFRMCLTDHPDNRIPFEKPDNYDTLNYELLLRNFEAGLNRIPFTLSRMPNRKTDSNNSGGFSTDFIGQNWDYPEASYDEREKIAEAHRNYQKGLMWTLANNPRVPAHIRNEVSRWGTTKDEFEREDGWQQQLYVREARRMTGAYVMTQKNCERIAMAEDPIGLAAYTMDSHNVQRYVTEEGFVRNEGNVESGLKTPYPISYRSLVPKADECTNLLVPVCLSASHIAYGSIRMEPVFMVLGQSAATAAALAIDGRKTVQGVNYNQLKARLLRDGQRLE